MYDKVVLGKWYDKVVLGRVYHRTVHVLGQGFNKGIREVFGEGFRVGYMFNDAVHNG